MKHLTSEQLILLYYGEPDETQDLAGHLRCCQRCRAELERLRQCLGSVTTSTVPARGENYGREVWQRLRPKLEASTRPAPLARLLEIFRVQTAVLAGRRWLLAAGVAVLMLAAFLAGRFGPLLATKPGPVALSPRHPGQGLVRSSTSWKELGDHLERSQLALIELINSKTEGLVDISMEKVLARELIDVNRLYCQAAAGFGDDGLVAVLSDLERTLVEISNSPAKLSSAQFTELRRRIDSDGVLFKVKVVSYQVRVRQQAALHEPMPNHS